VPPREVGVLFFGRNARGIDGFRRRYEGDLPDEDRLRANANSFFSKTACVLTQRHGSWLHFAKLPRLAEPDTRAHQNVPEIVTLAA